MAIPNRLITGRPMPRRGNNLAPSWGGGTGRGTLNPQTPAMRSAAPSWGGGTGRGTLNPQTPPSSQVGFRGGRFHAMQQNAAAIGGVRPFK